MKRVKKGGTRKASDPYLPGDPNPFRLSRTKIELFVKCPLCFYLDRRLGVPQPPTLPFSLNLAVDKLLKKEFDLCRSDNKCHPLLEKYGLDAKPVHHEKLNDWRKNRVGVEFLHSKTNLQIFGSIDDLWQHRNGQFIVVDYKATAKEDEVVALDQDWHDGYKQQIEIYQWLLRKNGLKVSDTAYFVYCNGITTGDTFDGKLEFRLTLVPVYPHLLSHGEV